MAKCCDYTIIPFSNVGVLDIAYSVNMRSRFGDVPNVRVYHKELGSTEHIEPMIEVRIDGRPATNIHINNGGNATGFVKLFR